MTTRESILAALFAVLQGVAGADVRRNEVLPEKIAAGGTIVQRDGTHAVLEVVLSPVSYLIEHTVELEFAVQPADPALRDTALDALLAAAGIRLALDRTLGGLADDVRAQFPEAGDQAVPGAAAVKSALVPVIVTYSTADPLG
jgi:hypothetical protein